MAASSTAGKVAHQDVAHQDFVEQPPPAESPVDENQSRFQPVQFVAATEAQELLPPPAADTLHPRLRVLTNQGAITVELDAEHAPISVSNFIGYVDAGHYEGTVFHQVEPGFIAAAGGYNEQLAEKVAPQRPIRNEADNGLKNVRGTIACARSPDVIDSTTSQFFFNLADNGQLDHSGREPAEYGYCVFGKVVDGLEVLDKIAAAPSGPQGDLPNVPQQAIVIERVTRVR